MSASDPISDQFSADKVRAILNDRAMDDEKIAEIKAMLPAQFPADKVREILINHYMDDAAKIAEIKAMIPAQLSADKVRALLYNRYVDDATKIAEIKAMLPDPAPARPTLADMTWPEREACRWMHADLNVADMTPEERPACGWTHADLKGGGSSVVILNHHKEDGRARVLWPCGCTKPVAWEKVTPRPDRVHMECPDTEKPAPAPTTALPDGWLLADHPEHGRVVVVRPEPDEDGEAAIIVSDPDNIDHAAVTWCGPDELTYIDQEADQ